MYIYIYIIHTLSNIYIYTSTIDCQSMCVTNYDHPTYCTHRRCVATLWFVLLMDLPSLPGIDPPAGWRKFINDIADHHLTLAFPALSRLCSMNISSICHQYTIPNPLVIPRNTISDHLQLV